MNKHYHPGILSLVIIAVCSSTQWLTYSGAQTRRSLPVDSMRNKRPPTLAEAYGRMPLHFVPNTGQLDTRIRFLVESGHQSLVFLDREIDLLLRYPMQASVGEKDRPVDVLRMRFLGARQGAMVRPGEVAEGKVNFFLGNDPLRWRSGVPTYRGVIYEELYPGIDLAYSGHGGQLESTYTVKPSGNVSDIRVRCGPSQGLSQDEEGNLVMRTSRGRVLESKPVGYQFVDGVRKDVPVRFRLDARARTYGFRVEDDYDTTRPLIIDPILGFSSYLGGSLEDDGNSIAVDGSGQLYITGFTFSTNFPTQSAFKSTAGGKGDAFVTKIGANGTTLVYSTYLGGGDKDEGTAIALDTTGQAYVTGLTLSTDFPLASAFRAANVKGDAFVTKLSSNGQSLVYSTYLGGADLDVATGIAVDSGGAAYVVGRTFSSTGWLFSNSFQTQLKGVEDAFLVKLASTGLTVVYGTYLGGSGVDEANAVAVDGSGQAFVTGVTSSLNFPTQSPYQGSLNGGTDAFVTRFATAGNLLVYSTYLGGSSDDVGSALVLDSAGNAYITGYTRSTDFPTISAFQGSNKGGNDAFLTELSTSGSTLVLSTYLGGAGEDLATAIARDSTGQLYLVGSTSSTDFPLANALDISLSGTTDAFVTQFASGAKSLVFSTYLGGSSDDSASGVGVDSTGKIYITGNTSSTDFTTSSARQSSFGGGASDAFYTRMDPFEPSFVTTLYFPRLMTSSGTTTSPDDSESTGIAVANLSSASATLKFTAYDTAGNLLGGSGIANPSQSTLLSKNQFAMLDTQVFGAGLATKKPTGWFKVQSTTSQIVGFFLVFNSTLSVQDGADVSSQTLPNFVLPEVEDLGFTQVHIANPGLSNANVTLELVESSGSVRATASPTRIIVPSGTLVEAVTTLFPSVTTFSGGMYIRGTATNPVVPFEYLGKTGLYVEGLNGQDPTAGAKTVYSPQYVVGGQNTSGGYRTTLSIVNFENTATNLTLKLVDDNGTMQGTRIESLPAKGKVQITAQNYFLTPDPNKLTQGYVQIVSDTTGIGGSVVFGDPNRNTFSTALPLVSKLLTTAIFSHVASNATYYTGLAVVNPGDSDTSFVLDVLDKSGTLVGTKTVSLQSKRRSVGVLTGYLPSLPSLSSGYFRITAAQGVLSFALFGTTKLDALSAIPPQAVP